MKRSPIELAHELMEKKRSAKILFSLSEKVKSGEEFRVTSRNLENFLWVHGFSPVDQYFDTATLMPTWCFDGTRELRDCVAEWEAMHVLKERLGVEWNDRVEASPVLYDVRNDKLEQFLWHHGIMHVGGRHNEERIYVWKYRDTEFLRAVVDEFRDLKEKQCKSKMIKTA